MQGNMKPIKRIEIDILTFLAKAIVKKKVLHSSYIMPMDGEKSFKNWGQCGQNQCGWKKGAKSIASYGSRHKGVRLKVKRVR